MSDPAGTDAVLAALVAARGARRPCVLATVVHFKGSTPRKPGAKMLVFPDAPLIGTIGGGALEADVEAQARGLLARGAETPALVERHLTHDLGMCCGGGMTVLLEPQTYAPDLLLFGAGHVAQPLAAIATLADFRVTVVDGREELANRERFPSVFRLVSDDPVDAVEDLLFDPRETYVVVVTHDHALDERITAAVMRRPFRFLGVIGSARKAEMFRKRLTAAGIPEETVARMQTPVGIDIDAETPAEIAVSIAAELVRVRRAG